MQAKFHMNLQWKSFNLNLPMVQAAIKALSPDCCGMSGSDQLIVHFLEVPAQAVQDQIQAYWDALNPQSPEAAYKSAAQERAEQEAAKAAAKAKLIALGLSEADLKALLGV